MNQLGFRDGALEDISSDVLNAHLIASSGIIDSYIGARYTLPLGLPYPSALERICVDLASYDLLLWRGFNPETFDTNYKDRALAAMEWLKDIKSGALDLPGVIGSPVDVASGRGWPQIYSKPLRGW
jgi:phage gp36-like protein